MTRLKPPQLITDLKELRIDVDQLKMKQRIGGDSLQGYVAFTANQWDYSFTLPAYKIGYLTVTFNSPTSGYVPMTQLMLFSSYNQPDVMNHAAVPWSMDGSYMITSTQKLVPSGTTNQWIVGFSNQTLGVDAPIYLKLVFSGTNSGSFTTL